MSEPRTNYEIATGSHQLNAAGGWVSLQDHLLALRAADEQRWQEVGRERDQRYAEVKAEQEKALVIKDTANRDALALARQDQTYKDEQANKLREQINSERGLYATKDDLANAVREMSATIKPLSDYISAAGGRSGGEAEQRSEQRLNNGQVMALLGLVVAVASIVVGILLATGH
jgi:hypothetical protein